MLILKTNIYENINSRPNFGWHSLPTSADKYWSAESLCILQNTTDTIFFF